MANINISVSNATGLVTVSIDWNDWKTFNVIDGSSHKVIPVMTGQTSTYTQSSPGMIEFYLSAHTNTLQLMNPGAHMVLAGSSSNYLCSVVYSGDGVKTPLTLSCFCLAVSQSFPSTGSSPIGFSQGHMLGSFSLTP